MTLDAPLERGVLLLDRQVPMAATPVGDGLTPEEGPDIGAVYLSG